MPAARSPIMTELGLPNLQRHEAKVLRKSSELRACAGNHPKKSLFESIEVFDLGEAPVLKIGLWT